MDKHQAIMQRRKYICKRYTLIFVSLFAYCVFNFKFKYIYFSNILSLLLMGSIWIPQIFRNCYHGYRNALNLKYAIVQSFYISFMPIYITIVKENVILREPQYIFGTFLIVWQFL